MWNFIKYYNQLRILRKNSRSHFNQDNVVYLTHNLFLSHVTALNVLRSKQIVHHAASGMECRGTCTIFLMWGDPYFPSQSWP